MGRELQHPLLCSECFTDHGLILEARKLGKVSRQKCPNCNSKSGAKLDHAELDNLAQHFFVNGTFHRTEFGGASVLQFNQYQQGKREVRFPAWLEQDAHIIEDKLGVGIFYYGPPLWRLGHIEPLKALEKKQSQQSASDDVVRRFPRRHLEKGDTFYRLRKGIAAGRKSYPSQYDPPPGPLYKKGRLNGGDFPVLYGSQDLEICVHECRVTKADECYVATLKIVQPLVLLDLCADINDDSRTPFESLALAIRFIFSAEKHSYKISRAIAEAAVRAGLDGIVFPSYFSSLRGDLIPNIALFGRPIKNGVVELLSINSLSLKAAEYTLQLGPCLRS